MTQKMLTWIFTTMKNRKASLLAMIKTIYMWNSKWEIWPLLF
jgi:hypothetical protein